MNSRAQRADLPQLYEQFQRFFIKDENTFNSLSTLSCKNPLVKDFITCDQLNPLLNISNVDHLGMGLTYLMTTLDKTSLLLCQELNEQKTNYAQRYSREAADYICLDTDTNPYSQNESSTITAIQQLANTRLSKEVTKHRNDAVRKFDIKIAFPDLKQYLENLNENLEYKTGEPDSKITSWIGLFQASIVPVQKLPLEEMKGHILQLADDHWKISDRIVALCAIRWGLRNTLRPEDPLDFMRLLQGHLSGKSLADQLNSKNTTLFIDRRLVPENNETVDALKILKDLRTYIVAWLENQDALLRGQISFTSAPHDPQRALETFLKNITGLSLLPSNLNTFTLGLSLIPMKTNEDLQDRNFPAPVTQEFLQAPNPLFSEVEFADCTNRLRIPYPKTNGGCVFNEANMAMSKTVLDRFFRACENGIVSKFTVA